MGEVKIVATLMIKDAYKEEFPQELRNLVTASRAEKGCKQYDLHKDHNNDSVFVFIERWASSQAVEEHNESGHFRHFGTFAKDKIQSLDVKLIDLIDI